MEYYTKTGETVVNELGSDSTHGLSTKAVAERLEKSGRNERSAQASKSLLKRFLAQFRDVMILILLAAAAVSFYVAWLHATPEELFEPALILLIVIFNAVLGVAQENRAEKALDALKQLSSPHARVIRDGIEQRIDAALLVPGDLLKLEAGDLIPADARLLYTAEVRSDESALTGESVPSEKDALSFCSADAPLGDRHNMVFTGCSITNGTATAIVTGTGMETELGKIASLLAHEEEAPTPLQQKLSHLGKRLGLIALAASAVVFLLGFLYELPLLELFMTAVSLAVSAIPEGLPAIVTIVLSIGVQRMVKQNAILRHLPAVETLGSASVICSDKTGTLTQNRMTLVKAYAQGEGDLTNLTGPIPRAVKELLRCATLCCNATITQDGETEIQLGDPTELAIVSAALQQRMSKEALNQDFPRLAELPFDSERKRMTTIHQADGQFLVITKGAFDGMIECCTPGHLEKAQEMLDQMSEDALRVLAVGYKLLAAFPEALTPEAVECDLRLLGLVGMIDPPRPEAKEAVAICRNAGIRPVMITGDHISTASAIAIELGILQEDTRAITGAKLDTLTDAELLEQVEEIAVYARVSPENKIRIVKAWQEKGAIVSMTGDGVNDAPALKAADIGCAMGITGTDVAKGASDLILTDDNFATIVHAVKLGRGIYENIRKVVGFLLGTNIGEVLTVLLSMLLWHKTPLLSMQLLWINLVTDSLPAIALGMERTEDDIMYRTPNPKNESIFSHGLGIQVILHGLLFAALTLLGFFVGEQTTGQVAGGRTMAFFILSLSQLIHAFNLRSSHSLFRIGLLSNHKLNWAVSLSAILSALVLFTPLHVIFGLMQLPWTLYLFALFLVLLPLPLVELSKFFRRQKKSPQAM